MTLWPRSRIAWRVPMLTAGVPRNAPSRIALLEFEHSSDPLREEIRSNAVTATSQDFRCEIDAGTADEVNILGPLAELDDAVARAGARRKVDVGEFRHGVADTLVDRAGGFASHGVRQRDVHV